MVLKLVKLLIKMQGFSAKKLAKVTDTFANYTSLNHWLSIN